MLEWKDSDNKGYSDKSEIISMWLEDHPEEDEAIPNEI